jgi:putative transposase
MPAGDSSTGSQPPPQAARDSGRKHPPRMGHARPMPVRPRLHRLHRLVTDQAIYFVTLCVRPRQPALDNDRVHHAFVAFSIEGLARGAHVGRYVLMPDHLHAFVAFGLTDDPAAPTISTWAKAIKGCISKVWRETGHSGCKWQKGFFDHVLRSSDSYAGKWEYVAFNPVRAGLTSKPDDWPYQGEICRLDAPPPL